MESHEVLKEVIQTVGAKEVAAAMRLSTSMVYKWCEAQEGAGAENPLDRVVRICASTKSVRPIEWLCERTGGFRSANPGPTAGPLDSVLLTTQSILKEFSELLEAVSRSYADDRRIDNEEAARIRKEWEDLKVIAEGFVAACEQGTYASADQEHPGPDGG